MFAVSVHLGKRGGKKQTQSGTAGARIKRHIGAGFRNKAIRIAGTIIFNAQNNIMTFLGGGKQNFAPAIALRIIDDRADDITDQRVVTITESSPQDIHS